MSVSDVCINCKVYKHVMEYAHIDSPGSVSICERCFVKLSQPPSDEQPGVRYTLTCTHGYKCGHKHKTSRAAFGCRGLGRTCQRTASIARELIVGHYYCDVIYAGSSGISAN